MRLLHSLAVRRAIIGLTVVSLATPVQPLMAAGPASQTSPQKRRAPIQLRSQDVELQANGTLQGYYIDAEQGAGKAGVKVTLHQNAVQPIATTTTGPNGAFQFDTLTGGAYQVVVNDEHVMAYRVWAAGTAPPRTSRHAMFKAGDATRADTAFYNWGGGSASPVAIGLGALIVGGIVAAVIIASDDGDKKKATPEGNDPG